MGFLWVAVSGVWMVWVLGGFYDARSEAFGLGCCGISCDFQFWGLAGDFLCVAFRVASMVVLGWMGVGCLVLISCTWYCGWFDLQVLLVVGFGVWCSLDFEGSGGILVVWDFLRGLVLCGVGII